MSGATPRETGGRKEALHPPLCMARRVQQSADLFVSSTPCLRHPHRPQGLHRRYQIIGAVHLDAMAGIIDDGNVGSDPT